MKKTVIGASLISLSLGTAGLSEVVVHDPYIIAAHNMAKVAAGFMVLENPTDEEITIESISTEFVQKSEIHTHNQNEDGVMEMRELEHGLTISPHSCVFLARGGYHFMLMGINQEINNDENVEIALHFEDDIEQKITVPIMLNKKPEQATPPKGYDECASAHDDHKM